MSEFVASRQRRLNTAHKPDSTVADATKMFLPSVFRALKDTAKFTGSLGDRAKAEGNQSIALTPYDICRLKIRDCIRRE